MAFKHLRVCQAALGQPTQEVGRKSRQAALESLVLEGPRQGLAFLEKITKVKTPGSGEAEQTPGWACNHLISRDTRLSPDAPQPQRLTVQQDPLGRLLYLPSSGPCHRQLH